MTKKEKTLVGLSVCGWAVVGLAAVGLLATRGLKKIAGQFSAENILKNLSDDPEDGISVRRDDDE
ncbi:MAG: hypothetical protein IJ852_03080 [Alphaproteobacteria bacterium]|nr:hypothetical protein [Alphaproteobacteria bacterium]